MKINPMNSASGSITTLLGVGYLQPPKDLTAHVFLLLQFAHRSRKQVARSQPHSLCQNSILPTWYHDALALFHARIADACHLTHIDGERTVYHCGALQIGALLEVGLDRSGTQACNRNTS